MYKTTASIENRQALYELQFFWIEAEIFHKNSKILHEIHIISTHLLITNLYRNGILHVATKQEQNKN